MRALLLVVLVIVTAGCGESPAGDANPTAPTTQTPPPQSGGCTKPNPPANLAASVTGSRVSLTWSPVGGAYDYMIYVGTTASSSNMLSTNTTQTNYHWNGANQGTYYVRVEARTACGSSDPSNPLTVVISG